MLLFLTTVSPSNGILGLGDHPVETAACPAVSCTLKKSTRRRSYSLPPTRTTPILELINAFVLCATRSTLSDILKGLLSAFLLNAMTCGGQPINREAGVYYLQASLAAIH